MRSTRSRKPFSASTRGRGCSDDENVPDKEDDEEDEIEEGGESGVGEAVSVDMVGGHKELNAENTDDTHAPSSLATTLPTASPTQ